MVRIAHGTFVGGFRMQILLRWHEITCHIYALSSHFWGGVHTKNCLEKVDCTNFGRNFIEPEERGLMVSYLT